MTNSNDNRFFKKDGKTVNKTYIAKKRSKEADTKLFSKWFVAFLVLISLLIIAYQAYRHPYMRISEVYVHGNKLTSDTEIIGRLQNPIGQNIFFFDPKAHEADIRDLEYVEDASVRKVFPNIVNVKIVENYPLFVQEEEGDKHYISNKGKYLGDGIENPDMKLVNLKGARLRKIANENFTSSEASLKFLLAIQQYSFASDLNELNLENKADIGIMINDIDVKFGDLNNINHKLKLLEKILNDNKEKGIRATAIDLDNGNNPVVKVDKESFSEDLNTDKNE